MHLEVRLARATMNHLFNKMKTMFKDVLVYFKTASCGMVQVVIIDAVVGWGGGGCLEWVQLLITADPVGPQKAAHH